MLLGAPMLSGHLLVPVSVRVALGDSQNEGSGSGSCYTRDILMRPSSEWVLGRNLATSSAASVSLSLTSATELAAAALETFATPSATSSYASSKVLLAASATVASTAARSVARSVVCSAVFSSASGTCSVAVTVARSVARSVACSVACSSALGTCLVAATVERSVAPSAMSSASATLVQSASASARSLGH